VTRGGASAMVSGMVDTGLGEYAGGGGSAAPALLGLTRGGFEAIRGLTGHPTLALVRKEAMLLARGATCDELTLRCGAMVAA
jgi:hypothetical protein